MIVVVIGLGSMGKRRVRLIKEMFPQYTVVGVDGREDRRKEATDLFQITCYNSLPEIRETVDCAFVCTSPLSHASIISECLNNHWNVFTELNLVTDAYKENMKLADKNKCKLFLSSTFFYREEIKYIRSKIDADSQWNYIYHIGQYLPDWHPWETYNDFFIGNARTNGCREIMAIELPWLLNTFGNVKSTNTVSDKMSALNIGFHDNYMIQLEHVNGNKGVLVVDVVSPAAVRKFEAYSEGKYLSWNGTPDSLFEFNKNDKSLQNVSLSEKTEHMEGYSQFIVENAYKNEIKEFFDVVMNHKKPLYGFSQDEIILNLIDALGA
ncbi:MAG: Gfo/Idh/MocA family oxidoreductase [Parasporobacterium sp.]|nr:Gfo/Idh/MocA family oxidoreductase [Parasporobacterium sp.]